MYIYICRFESIKFVSKPNNINSLNQMIELVETKESMLMRAHLAVTSIQTCVRLLVENSINAASTIIEIHVTKYPSKCVIIDNGHGIHPIDFHLIGSMNSKLKNNNSLTPIHTHSLS